MDNNNLKSESVDDLLDSYYYARRWYYDCLDRYMEDDPEVEQAWKEMHNIEEEIKRRCNELREFLIDQIHHKEV